MASMMTDFELPAKYGIYLAKEKTGSISDSIKGRISFTTLEHCILRLNFIAQ